MTRGAPLSDDARFPTIPLAERGLLRDLRQHVHGPMWTFASGDRVTEATLEALRAFRLSLDAPVGWRAGETPEWVSRLTSDLEARVPFYRRRAADGAPPSSTMRRHDLFTPWDFVPDDADLDELLVFHTSGSTGRAFHVYATPFAANAVLPVLERALADAGITLDGGAGRVTLASVHHQLGTFTYPSLMRYFDGAAYVKLNLHPTSWRDPADIVPFLDELAPEVWLGDPYAFARLAELPVRHRPKALISSATRLLPGMRKALVERFACPVLDAYSLTECRMVGLAPDDALRVQTPGLFVEVFELDRDEPVAPGATGELVVTGGTNPLLPLLRYRTGDRARLVHDGDQVFIHDLSGRAPVCLTDKDGEVVNTVDVCRALSPLALPRFRVVQDTSGAVVVNVDDGARSLTVDRAITTTLTELFRGRAVTVGTLADDDGAKVMEFAGAMPWPLSLRGVLGATS